MTRHVAPKLELLDTLTIPEQGQVAAGQAATALDAAPGDAGLVLLAGTVRVEIPPAVADAVRQLVGHALEEASRGHTVVLAATPEAQVSTGVAADMLGMSRTHLVNLINRGVLPSQKVRDGARSHRRVRLSDVAAYRRQREGAAAALVGLEQIADAFDLDAFDALDGSDALDDTPPDASPRRPGAEIGPTASTGV